MADPSLTVVIPVHNGAAYLREALASVVGQTCPADEILVVDDGSTDGSGDVARAFDPTVRVLRQDRLGPSAARNAGLTVADNELVAFLDADDLWLPRKLERQTARFRTRPSTEMSTALTENFWSPDLRPGERDHEAQPRGPWPGHLGTWVIRREIFDRLGGFDEAMALSQDVDWHLRAHAGGVRIEAVDEVLGRRRLHAGNRTRHRREDCRAAVLASLRRHHRNAEA